MKLGAPAADELGFAKSLRVVEIGGTRVIQLEQDASAGAVSTVVLRASTEQLLDDLERAIDDGVNTYRVRNLSCNPEHEPQLCNLRSCDSSPWKRG